MTRAVPGRSQPSQPILVHAVTVTGTPAVNVSGTSTAGSVGRSDPITDGASLQSCWKIAHAATEAHRTMSLIRGRDGGLANDIMKIIARRVLLSGPTRNRTENLLIKSQLLCQLSYRPLTI